MGKGEHRNERDRQRMLRAQLALARQTALNEVYGVALQSRREARALLKRHIIEVFEFLEKEDRLFDQAAQRIKGTEFLIDEGKEEYNI